MSALTERVAAGYYVVVRRAVDEAGIGVRGQANDGVDERVGTRRRQAALYGVPRRASRRSPCQLDLSIQAPRGQAARCIGQLSTRAKRIGYVQPATGRRQ